MKYNLVLSSLLVFILFSCKDNVGIPNEVILLDAGWQVQKFGRTSDSIFSYDKYVFKNEFELSKPGKEQYVTLNFDRSNQSAVVSLNSHQIVSGSDVDNPYGKRIFNITSQLEDQNYLEIEAGYTDWATPGVTSRERLPGVQTDIRKSMIGNAYLKITGSVSIINSEILTKVNTSTLDEAWLTLHTLLRNNSNKPVKGKLSVMFEDRKFTVPVRLNPNEEKSLVLTPDDHPELFVANPRIWWINDMGPAEIYRMNLAFETAGNVSDTDEFPFCIRDIKEYITSNQHRGYMLNGKKIFIKGAAWDNDIYYRSTPGIDDIQVQYAKDMNLNAIFFNSDRNAIRLPYELCDKYGLLALENVSIECDTLAMVESGPFDYVGPAYWYGDSTFVRATGFNLRAGIGAQLPLIESLRKMIPAEHLNLDTLENNLDKLTEVIVGQYGEVTDLYDYLRKADLLNYEGTKAMFEAFRIYSPIATGVVQWKLSSALPSLYWQLYDYYLTPTSAYYAVKKANTPEQLLYNYKTNSIYYVNDIVTPVERRARISFYGTDSKLMYVSDFKFRVEADCSKNIFSPDPIAGNVFMHLQLFDNNNNPVSENFYSISENMEEYDWNSSDDSYVKMSSFADYKALNELPEAELFVNFHAVSTEEETLILQIEATTVNDVISFMTRFLLKDDAGNVVVPVFWEDNYVAVLPNEPKKLRCKIDREVMDGKKISLYVSGWNLPEKEIPLIL